MMQAAEIHARLSGSWPSILVQLGVPETALRNRHGPCPACGGKDRFRFDNKKHRGDWICNQCGAGDGFRLLERVHGWPFAEARKRVIEAAGLSEDLSPTWTAPAPPPRPTEAVATPSERVRRLRRQRCAVADCADVRDYLASRGLWPLPNGCTLSAHATAEYWNDGHQIGRYAAMLADVVDQAGELVTLHVTYLQGGKKLDTHEPRKILRGMQGRTCCAVRLMPAGDVLGVAEGVETALSAAAIDGVPVWAALNTALLVRFEPPDNVKTLRLYVDRDEAGLTAALRLAERLQGRVQLEVRIPRAPAKDWNDTLMAAAGRKGTDV